MIRRSVTLTFILMLLMVTAGMRSWPVVPAIAAEGPGFEWRMLPRHLGTSLVNPNDLAAARNYVHPTDGYRVSFNGCETLEDTLQSVTHTYTITGSTLPEARTVSVSASPQRLPIKLGGGFEEISCDQLRATTQLPPGSYEVSLSVETTGGEATTYSPRSIVVRDILIISVGDSYGSGEGAPDREVQYGLFGYPTEPAIWQDQNCHRSAWAGPSQAAAILENSDPYTSVTFISLACSGATINTPIDDNPDDGRINEATFQGAGLLAPYSGIEPKGNFDASMSPWQPTQMEQAARIADGRAIDALTISGGGNDMHFATVITDCVLSDCSTNETTRKRLNNDFAELPKRYQELADFITGDRNRNGAPALNITPDRVFITEYPDPTRNMNGDWCETNQIDDPLLSLPATGIMKHEMAWASANVVNSLNTMIKNEADKHGWNTVSGIAAEFFGDPTSGLPGRGWCALGADANGAPNNWVNRSTDALAIQGPHDPNNLIPIGLWATVGAVGIVLSVFTSGWSLLVTAISGAAILLQLKATDGTMHPNRMGQMVYARHIASSIEARLSGKIADPGDTTPPTIEPAQNITVQTMDGDGEVVDYPIPATNDDTDGDGLASCSPASGSLFRIGTTRVICTARDASGNVANPVGFSVIVDPITVSLPDAPDGETSLRSGCTNEDGDDQDLTNDAGPLSFNGTNVTGFTRGSALKARASATDDDCGMRLTHSTGVTVGAGDTGLAEGEPVLVSLTLGLDGFLSSSAEGNQVSVLSMDASYSITETNCPDPGPAPMSVTSRSDDPSATSDGPGFDLGGENGGYCPSIMDFSASVDMNHYGNTDQWYARGGWSITSNIGEEQGEYRDISCDDYCSDPSHLPLDTRSRTVIFETRVGAHLEINGMLDAFATGYLGSTAVSDFSNTFAMSVVQPAPGYEGLTFTYDNTKPTDPGTRNGAPTIDAGGPYSVDEGGSVVLTASGNDPDGDDLSYAWDLDGDGSFETEGETVTFSAANLNGPFSQSIAVQVTDDQGAVGEATGVVEVANVTPVVILGTDATVRRGETFSDTGSFTDPGADVWTGTVNYGDGSPDEVLTINPDGTFNLSHTYTTAGTFVVTTCITDDVGAGCDVLSLTVTPYAVYAGRDDCRKNGEPAIQWSGGNGTVIGDLHSNAGLKVGGSSNLINGSATYRCDEQISGKENTFGEGPAQVSDSRPWPMTLTRADFVCDISVTGTLDLSNDGAWWVDGTMKSGRLSPLTLCADEILLDGSNVAGSVTLVAGKVTISGSNLRLTPDQHGILAFATGADSDAIKISGSKSQWSGDLVAMAGGIDLSGSDNAMTNGGVIGWTVKLSGSNWTIDATP